MKANMLDLKWKKQPKYKTCEWKSSKRGENAATFQIMQLSCYSILNHSDKKEWFNLLIASFKTIHGFFLTFSRCQLKKKSRLSPFLSNQLLSGMARRILFIKISWPIIMINYLLYRGISSFGTNVTPFISLLNAWMAII